MTSDTPPLPPGATIGVLGGGQLGRMLALAAAPLGYRVAIYSPDRDSVAGDVAASHVCAPWDEADALARFVGECDAVTYEFENVPVAPLRPHAASLAPGLEALETAQDRAVEKRFVEALGGRAAPWRAVDTGEDLAPAIDAVGTPGILKTRRAGYDGKGQWRIDAARDAEAIRWPGAPCVYEGRVRFEAEFSILLARGRDGAVRFWDAPENHHEDGVLRRSTLPPCEAVAAQAPDARALAERVAARLGYVGVLALEFFATAEGPVFNEMAPRVHNSGHWTIEGAATSQFENHIRAVAGLPLGDTATIVRTVEMGNLIGEPSHEALAEPGVSLHLYGKREARPGRKMGHVTRVER